MPVLRPSPASKVTIVALLMADVDVAAVTRWMFHELSGPRYACLTTARLLHEGAFTARDATAGVADPSKPVQWRASQSVFAQALCAARSLSATCNERMLGLLTAILTKRRTLHAAVAMSGPMWIARSASAVLPRMERF